MEYHTGTVVFGDWVIVEKIGEGASGQVFKIQKTIERNNSKTYVYSALKVIRIPRSASDVYEVRNASTDEKSVTEYFQKYVDQIINEIEIMSELKGHPNIVSYEDHSVIPHRGEVGWDILLKMELLIPFQEWQTNHMLDETEVLKLGRDISAALAFARNRGLVHRDVKPQNIFVDEFGNFKLGDFGISRTIEKTMSGLSRKGTESYMAPEVYNGNAYGESVDVYSLGLVLYKCLNNNRLPFFPPISKPIRYSDREEALNKRIAGYRIPELENVTDEFMEILYKACEFNPQKRIKNAEELYESLDLLEKKRRQESGTKNYYGKRDAEKTELIENGKMYHTGRNSGSRTYTSEKKQGKNRKTAGVIGAFAVVCMLFLVIAAGYKILPYINNSEEKGSYRIISDGYEMLTQTYDGYMRMQRNEKWGFLDEMGREVIPAEYDFIKFFGENGLAPAQKDGRWYYIDKENNIVENPVFDEYEYMGILSNGFIPAKQWDGKWGYLDSDFNKVSTFEYDQALPFLNGIAAVKKGEMWALINNNMEVTTDYIYDNIVVDGREMCSYNNVVFVYVGDKKYLVNGNGKKICEDAFEDAAPFLSVGPVAVEMNGKWGYISSDGKKVIDYQYERGRSFTQIGYAAAKQNGKYGYIDEKNHWVIQPEFIQARACNDHGIAAVESEEGIWKLIQIE